MSYNVSEGTEALYEFLKPHVQNLEVLPRAFSSTLCFIIPDNEEGVGWYYEIDVWDKLAVLKVASVCIAFDTIIVVDNGKSLVFCYNNERANVKVGLGLC